MAGEPSSNHLYLLFGEFFDGSRATFYNSVLRYDISKNEWREYKNAEGPAPRSSAAGVGMPGFGEGGSIFIFGGEYASPTQTSFHHYKDLVSALRPCELLTRPVGIQYQRPFMGENRDQEGSIGS